MTGQYKLTSIIAAATLLLLGAHSACAGVLADEAKRKLFLGAEKISAAGKPLPVQMDKLLRNYPLYPYLEYKRLKRTLGTARNAEVTRFLGQHDDTPLANLLRSRWLNVLASRKDWNSYIEFYTPQSNISRQCHYLQALIQIGRAHV